MYRAGLLKRIKISPPLPSLIILWSVSEVFPHILRHSVELVYDPSFTSSCSDFQVVSHIFPGSFSNSFSRKFTSSSLCFSVPTMGETSVSISARIRWIDGALALSLTQTCCLPDNFRLFKRQFIHARGYYAVSFIFYFIQRILNLSNWFFILE